MSTQNVTAGQGLTLTGAPATDDRCTTRVFGSRASTVYQTGDTGADNVGMGAGRQGANQGVTVDGGEWEATGMSTVVHFVPDTGTQTYITEDKSTTTQIGTPSAVAWAGQEQATLYDLGVFAAPVALAAVAPIGFSRTAGGNDIGSVASLLLRQVT